MTPATYKSIVRRYFEEAIDGRNVDVLDDIASEHCLVHRPETSQPIRGRSAFKEALRQILQTYSEFHTTVHDLVAEGDRVACRLTHRAVNARDWISRIGRHEVAGKPVSWSAIVIFRFQDGRIAEEWVSRDELGMLMQIGAVASAA